jgi:hypothetical protein
MCDMSQPRQLSSQTVRLLYLTTYMTWILLERSPITSFLTELGIYLLFVEIFTLYPFARSLDRSVGIATGYGLDEWGFGVRVPEGSTIFSSPRRPDCLRGPPKLLSNGYRGLFPRGYRDRGVKLTTHLQLVPRSRQCGSIHPRPHMSSWRSAYLVKHRDNFTFYPSVTNCISRVDAGESYSDHENMT